MLDFHDALNILQNTDFRMPLEIIDIEDSYRRILCEEASSDIDMPPFDKSAMDGYACRKADIANKLEVIGTLYAGSSENYTVEPGTCVKIMTGAPIPKGADTVLMIEHTEQLSPNSIVFKGKSTKANICYRGEDVRTGDVLLKKGTLLEPHAMAILASAGYAKVSVSKLPQVAIVSTGSELVPPATKPTPAQIRNSNAYNLIGQLHSAGIAGHFTGILPDEKELIKQHIVQLTEKYDILIITGGASQGEHDFIPQLLSELNFEMQFDKLALQPGKPVSFAYGSNKFCFGLSGNPVSSYIQFEILVKPFLYHIMHHSYEFPILFSELAHSMHRKNASRLKFFPVRFTSDGKIEEIHFNGSAHIAGLTGADGFGLFPRDCEALDAGDKIEMLLLK